MNFYQILLSLGLLTVYGYSVSAQACASTEQVCHVSLRNRSFEQDQCYNPQYQVCADNLICPLDNPKRCQDSCYGDNNGYCHIINRNLSILCPRSAPHLCQQSCYDANLYECKDFQLTLRGNGANPAVPISTDPSNPPGLTEFSLPLHRNSPPPELPAGEIEAE